MVCVLTGVNEIPVIIEKLYNSAAVIVQTVTFIGKIYCQAKESRNYYEQKVLSDETLYREYHVKKLSP